MSFAEDMGLDTYNDDREDTWGDGTYIDSDGEEYRIEEMKSSHLQNTIGRRIRKKKKRFKPRQIISKIIK